MRRDDSYRGESPARAPKMLGLTRLGMRSRSNRSEASFLSVIQRADFKTCSDSPAFDTEGENENLHFECYTSRLWLQ
jgi:hypothetical protein